MVKEVLPDLYKRSDCYAVIDTEGNIAHDAVVTNQSRNSSRNSGRFFGRMGHPERFVKVCSKHFYANYHNIFRNG